MNVPKLPVDGGEIAIPDKKALVLFWANWCGHCQAYKPKYEKLATMLRNKGIYQLHCVDNAAMCSELGIQGYPTLKCWQDGKLNDCSLNRDDLDALKRWVSRQAGGARKRSRKRSRRRSKNCPKDCPRRRSNCPKDCPRRRSKGRRCCAKTAANTRCTRYAQSKYCYQHRCN